jgi:hypothetical protein
VLKVKKVNKEMMVLEGKKVKLENEALKVLKALKALKVLKALKALMGNKVLRVRGV